MSVNSPIGFTPVRAAVAAILGTASFMVSVPVSAADASADEQLEEVQVTGTRIRRANDFDTANPTTVVDAEYFKNMGIVNVGDAIRQLPSNVSNNSPTTTGNANFFAGSTIANLRGLNPFFGSRTLNLVNGRRFVPTNQGDGVDLNFLPSVLIERMDVVTGGASAAYGSGAISGVNNVFLNRKLQGGKVEMDYGQSAEKDAKDRHIAAAFGTEFASGRGHVTLGFEHQKSDAVGCITARDWCAEGNAFIQNPANPANGGTNATAPLFVLASDVRAGQISSAGVWQNFAAPFLPTLAVNAAGTGTIAYNVGTGAVNSPFNNVVGGDGKSVYQYTNLRAPVTRNVGAATVTYELTDSLNLSVDVSYGKVETDNRTGALDAQFTSIAADNAYLTPALATAQATYALFPGGPAFFNKDWTSQVNSHSAFSTKVKRFAAGLDGKFGDSSWTWDGYFQYGRTDRSQLVDDNRHLNAFNLAVDAVVDNRVGSATFGQTVCRVTRDGVPSGALYDPRIAQGCVPLNTFGTGAISPAAKAYAFGFLLETLKYEQQVLAFNATGDLFEGFGAGTIKGAAGVEYRTEKGTNTGSQNGAPDYVRTDYLIQYGESFAGKVDVIEGYVESNIPVLRGVTGAQRLEFDVSARVSSYRNKGGAGTTGAKATHDMTTWKISGIWDPVDWLRVRGSQSRDSRAANFRELYYGQQVKAGGIFGFCGPALGVPVDPCNWSLEGNTALKPEKSDTTTVGLVFTPSGVEGLQFAADFFNIKIKDSITQASVFRTLQGCQIGNVAEFCALLVPDVPGDFTSIKDLRALAYNGSGYKYSGIDFTGSYKLDLAEAGALNFRLIATKMLKQTSPNGFQPNAKIDVLGQTGTSNNFLSDNQPSAKWIGNLSATYLKGPFTATAQMRYVSSGVVDYQGAAPGDANYGQNVSPGVPYVTLSTNSVPSYKVFGLNASYTFENLGLAESLQVWGGIDNLFDKDPPIATGSGFGGAANGGTNPVFFDTIGRYYKLGLRLAF